MVAHRRENQLRQRIMKSQEREPTEDARRPVALLQGHHALRKPPVGKMNDLEKEKGKEIIKQWFLPEGAYL